VHRFDGSSFSSGDESTCFKFEDVPVAIAVCKTEKIVATAVGEQCRFYRCEPSGSWSLILEKELGHKVSCLDFSPDGSLLYAATEEGPIGVYSYPAMKQLYSFDRHRKGVHDLQACGEFVISASRDRKTFLWSSTDGTMLQQLESPLKEKFGRLCHIRTCRRIPHAPVTTLAVAEATPSQGSFVSIWTSEDSSLNARQSKQRNVPLAVSPMSSMRVLREPITCLRVAGAGDLLAAASAEGHIVLLKLLRGPKTGLEKVWTTESFIPSWNFPLHTLPVTAIDFSGPGDFLFSASADSSISALATNAVPTTELVTLIGVIGVLLTFLIGLLVNL